MELDQLLDMPNEEFVQLVHARARRRFQRGLKRGPMALIKKLRKAKKEAPPNEKPAVVRTHLRDMIVVPEMIGSVIGIYNGKVCRNGRGNGCAFGRSWNGGSDHSGTILCSTNGGDTGVNVPMGDFPCPNPPTVLRFSPLPCHRICLLTETGLHHR